MKRVSLGGKFSSIVKFEAGEIQEVWLSETISFPTFWTDLMAWSNSDKLLITSAAEKWHKYISQRKENAHEFKWYF